MNKLKKSILALACVATLIGGGCGYLMSDFKRKAISPIAYLSQDERFRIKFPLDPKESHQELHIAGKQIAFRQLSVEHGETFYAVSYLDFPGHWKWLGSQKLLAKTFEMVMENELDAEVITQQLSTHNGDPALVYKVKQNGKESIGKFVIADTTLYRVAVTYPKAASDSTELHGFIDSFEVNG